MAYGQNTPSGDPFWIKEIALTLKETGQAMRVSYSSYNNISLNIFVTTGCILP